jgi:hypothetical protein
MSTKDSRSLRRAETAWKLKRSERGLWWILGLNAAWYSVLIPYDLWTNNIDALVLVCGLGGLVMGFISAMLWVMRRNNKEFMTWMEQSDALMDMLDEELVSWRAPTIYQELDIEQYRRGTTSPVEEVKTLEAPK